MAKPGCLKQMMTTYNEVGGNLVAIEEVAREEHTNRYGILDVVDDDGVIVKAKGLVEKPKPVDAPINIIYNWALYTPARNFIVSG